MAFSSSCSSDFVQLFSLAQFSMGTGSFQVLNQTRDFKNNHGRRIGGPFEQLVPLGGQNMVVVPLGWSTEHGARSVVT